MLFTSQTGLDISSLFENEYIDQYALQESVNNCEMKLRMFEYDYNHEYHDAEMVAIEAYKDHNDDMALLESQFEVITEGFLGKIWEKFKSFLKMIWNGIVKLVTKLLEFLHLKKKKIEEEQKKADEEEKQMKETGNASSTSTSQSSSSSAPKSSTTPSNQSSQPVSSEKPENMSQAIQQQEEKKQEEKKQKEGYFSQNKKPTAPRKNDRAYAPKNRQDRKGGHGTRKIPKNMIVVQTGYIDITKAIDSVGDIQVDILEFFKSVADIIKDLLAGKTGNKYLEKVVSPEYTNSDRGKNQISGQYNSPKGNMKYGEILDAVIKPKYVKSIKDDSEEEAAHYGLKLLVGDSFNTKEAKIPIKRTIKEEYALYNKFITVTSKVINRNKLNEIKKACDDVERAINNITDNSEIAKANASINKLAYNGFRRAYMAQLQLIRGVDQATNLTKRGIDEAEKAKAA